MSNTNEMKAKQALHLYNLASLGDAICDADTILADVMEKAGDFEDQIGLEILTQYLAFGTEAERRAFEHLFYSMSGVEWGAYLERVIAETYSEKLVKDGVDAQASAPASADKVYRKDSPVSDRFELFLCERNDEIDNTAYNLAVALTSNENLTWNQSYIGEIADAAEATLQKQGYQTCHPFFEGEDERPCYLGEDCDNPHCPFRKEGE